jgi:hypothetical protein
MASSGTPPLLLGGFYFFSLLRPLSASQQEKGEERKNTYIETASLDKFPRLALFFSHSFYFFPSNMRPFLIIPRPFIPKKKKTKEKATKEKDIKHGNIKMVQNLYAGERAYGTGKKSKKKFFWTDKKPERGVIKDKEEGA